MDQAGTTVVVVVVVVDSIAKGVKGMGQRIPSTNQWMICVMKIFQKLIRKIFDFRPGDRWRRHLFVCVLFVFYVLLYVFVLLPNVDGLTPFLEEGDGARCSLLN